MTHLRPLIELRLAPEAGVIRMAEAGRWQVETLPARIRLSSEQAFPSGWVLIEARLRAYGCDRTALLFADTGVPEAEMPVFELPLSAKGILVELVQLPPGTHGLILQPMNSIGEFSLIGPTLRQVGRPERFLRMGFRVLATRHSQPHRRLQRLGLRWHMPLLNLKRAYQLAGYLRAYAPAPAYPDWLARFDRLDAHDLKRIADRSTRLLAGIRFNVLIASASETGASQLQRTTASLAAQLLAAASVADAAIDAPASQQEGDARKAWVFLLPAGATLSPHALYWFAHEISRHPAAGFLYCDHDRITESGERSEPAFKPDWSPELLRSANYIGPAAAVRADIWIAAGGYSAAAGMHDLWLRVSEQLESRQILHICAPLLHLPTSLDARFAADDAQAVARHLARTGMQARVDSDQWGHCRVHFALPEQRPLISIIVPTRDRLDLLQPCIESVLAKTRYREFELLVVDNLSRDPECLAYLTELAARQPVRVLRYPHTFNYSAINNFAADEARGDYLCLLNNDTAVISPDWLAEMLGRLLQPDVGAVGATLYYADGRVQHGGDTVGPGGCANHLHHLLPGDAPGYLHRVVLAQDLSAVTGACLLTRRDLYLSLGGLNERDLAIAFNDVDYCLRLREAGWRVVWTPYAELYHHESVSRGRDESPEKRARADREVAYMKRRWNQVMRNDPFYNPNLSYARPDFSLSHAPLVERPWETA